MRDWGLGGWKGVGGDKKKRMRCEEKDVDWGEYEGRN